MAKVAMIVPSEKMLTLAKPMLESYSHVDMVLLEHVDPGDSQKALKIARSAIAQGCELIIARGVQAMLIKSNTSVPVVEIQLTAQEVGSELLKMRELLNDPLPRIGLVILDNMVSDISRINELFPVELREYYTDDYGALPAAVDRALADGCLGIIGGHTACARAEELGLMCRFLPESGESLRNAMAIASRICYAIDLRKRSLSEMDTMLNNTFTGIMQVSRGGKIHRFNQSVSSLLGKEEDILHRSVTEVIPKLPRQVLDDALLHGKEKYAFVLDIRGKAVIVSIAPVFIDKEVDSAILTFQEEKRIVEMNSELRTELYQRGYIARFSFEQMVCKSKLTQDVIRTAKRIAGFQAPILLTGEAGVGKKILAQCIHRESLWHNSAFVSVDCSAWIPETVDDMLFGNYSTRKDAPACLAELAQNGTLFLDHLDAPYWRDGITLTETEVRDARMIPTNAGSGGTMCHQGGGGSYRGCQVLVEDVTIAHSFTENGKARTISPLAPGFASIWDGTPGWTAAFWGRAFFPPSLSRKCSGWRPIFAARRPPLPWIPAGVS